jgi:hypothetical protein
LLFDGGSLEFKLEVREGAAAVREVPVTLNVTPTIIPESITIFSVTRTPAQTGDEEGSLTKINVEKEVDGQLVPIATLLDAFKWIDTKTVEENNPEYLVRVEKDEQIPKVILSCTNDEKIIIRLRGYEKERKITWDGSTSTYHNTVSSYRTYPSLINIGVLNNDDKSITLQLEQHITLDGEGKISSTESGALTNAIRLYGMITVYLEDTLIMKSGSKLTGYMHPGETYMSSESCIPIRVYFWDESIGQFILDGGEITGNTVGEGVISAANTGSEGLEYGNSFVYKSGKIYDNFRADGSPGNYRVSNNSEILAPVEIAY